MAAHEEPAPNFHRWTEDQQSSDRSDESRGLEVRLMGMTLMTEGESGFSEPVGSLASSPPIELQQTDQYKGSVPSSPDSDLRQLNAKNGIGRGSSVQGSHPSPIGKTILGQSSKNTSATSPLLTLTPNSSVDGHNEWHTLGGVIPSLPFLQAEHRKARGDNTGFGSFDLAIAGNDGLHGLGALRDRSYSSPGPLPILSSSPPIVGAPRGNISAHVGNAPESGNLERSRSVPRDRPPLSHSYQEGSSSHAERGIGFSSNRSTGSEVSHDSGFGAIGRAATPPDTRSIQTDFEISRRRASSGDEMYNPYSMDQSSVTQKFGSLPTLGSHLQKQRMNTYGNGEQLERPRHIRSVSQPIPMNQMPPRMSDHRFYQQNLLQEGHSYSGGEIRPRAQHGSQSFSSFAAYDGYPHQKRASLPNLSQPHGFGHVHGVRGSLDYHESPHSHSHGSVIASADEIRAFTVPSMISPGQSPVQMYFSAHSRQSSDGGSTMLSSSPMSMGAMPRVGSGRLPRHQNYQGDEELTHPLIGEHIEVPDHDELQSGMYGGMQQVLPRPPTHAHSLSLDHLPPYAEIQQFGATGSILPMPKVVYAVKFKRTQRNFVLGPRINRDLKIGTYVKVEADRGEDLGIVVGTVPAEKANFTGSRVGFGGPSSAGMGTGAADLKRIVRLATHDEVSLLALKREEEDELLKICRTKVRQRGLPMHVIDAEYQFDRHKLTFFFEAEGRVDFRELVRDLFSMYKTRIWMQQIDKSTASSALAMMAPSASAVQMDYGIPIIAPASEFADSIVLGAFGDARSH